MLNNNQPLCANISGRQSTNIVKSIPNDESETDEIEYYVKIATSKAIRFCKMYHLERFPEFVAS